MPRLAESRGAISLSEGKTLLRKKMQGLICFSKLRLSTKGSVETMWARAKPETPLSEKN